MSDMQASLGLGEERPATGEDGSIAGPEISLALLDTTARPVRRGAAPQAPRLRQGGIHRRPARGAEARGLREGRTFPR